MDTTTLRELHSQGLTDAQIAKQMNIKRATIQYNRSRMGLKSNFDYNMFETGKKEMCIDLVKQGFSDIEIAKKLNISEITVWKYRINENIKRDNRLNKSILLTDIQKEFVVGCLLGDGNLNLRKQTQSPVFKCDHCIQQKEYAEFKYNILKSIGSKINYYKRKKIDPRNNIYYESYTVTLPANPELLYFYNEFYKPKKVITKEILKYYTPFAMAIHFMDDGSNQKYGYIIATNGFDMESLNIYVNFMKETYNIECSIHKSGAIYIKSKSVKTFHDLVKPYIIKSLLYKINKVT